MTPRYVRQITSILIVSAALLLSAGCVARKSEWTSSGASHVPTIPKGEPWSFQESKGRIIKTAHFTIYTTARDAVLLEKLPDFLEGAYEKYLAFLPPAKDDEKPLVIYLFGRRSEWEAYTKDYTGAQAETYLKIRAGAYSYQGTCVAYMLERYHTFGVLAHEGFHQFAHRRLGHRIPPWMEEGLACNFEAHVWKNGKPEFTPDLNEFRISALERDLRNNRMFSLEELTGMQAGTAINLPPEKTATFYAQAWALTRFLQEGKNGKFRDSFRQLLDDAASGADLASRDQGLQIFESYFKENSEIIAKEALQYAKRLVQRQIEPGMEISVVGRDPNIDKIVVTAEQIEETVPEKTVEPAE
ncbi:MAG: DUF1570 domain-containing protein [Actinobacteria bacterium]|nr:DUF1570 domain-containing protein [Actinomycetota bacterium]